MRGAWTPQTEALFDIRVIDTDAQSYRHQIPLQVLITAERRKRTNIVPLLTSRREATVPPLTG